MDLAAIREGRCPLGGATPCTNPANVHARTARVCEQHAALILPDNWRSLFRRQGDDWIIPDVAPAKPAPEPGKKTAVKAGTEKK